MEWTDLASLSTIAQMESFLEEERR